MTDVRLSFPGDRKAYTFYGGDDIDEQPLVHRMSDHPHRDDSRCGRRAGIIVGGHLVGFEHLSTDPAELTCPTCIEIEARPTGDRITGTVQYGAKDRAYKR